MAKNFADNKKNEKEFEEKVIQISRVSKKTKGGNKLSFSVLMVVGDKKGRVGIGLGKASGVPEAMRKASANGKKKMIRVPLKGNTIAREISFKNGAALVFLKPAAPGTGVIAGGPVKAVIEVAGIRDILSKVLGSNNQMANVYTTFKALKKLGSWNEIRNQRMGERQAIKQKTKESK
ncbi:30S ribosomal protein S5 [candidate division CPR3 bacterium GWF2_35_18]|uniref:Small ribosomal subunit protein uS5 n=1 Tax=candidate division CPR3 bacterium GW2011_GWF2_35_18 TaxID=1618350 RepID=A0A0G0EQT0_UNCC3|nr:MAG: 30S ribosomal protein S5 [candidate division CPR3 bacterium GW2011_GWF2_35_18]KKP86077.1 MAG: 30S ribosomal protein S5 [candidate division CPR3 bacterium GW2011_GWE2_35_7]OGB63155.1 MAG: 30S ribosomal protein S5 [candidate division CPR3 bacterium GWF2_35_18]OGB64031.1 MAG: 30S ribosomal protein S5 [candidate division CPR3 bacterium RIFOXYA2_FULL_35_13]OGB75699.1 MAG: 30S ribosomal protein S5 [candidate division CPR3 bacterium RIFOXYC2_FULL_35_7]OGB78228.1 MAG: 30S ribosomal protein S5 